MTILFVAAFGQYDYGAVHLPLPCTNAIIADCTPVFKLPECLLLLWAGEKLAKTSYTLKKVLLIMGQFSFSIFFLHNILIAILEELFFWTVAEHPMQDTAWLYVVGFAITPAVCGICILGAMQIKERLGKTARIYIGA